MKKKLVAIVDDWERLERYEEHLSSLFEVHCAPFGRFGVQLALELKPEFILVDVVFEDLHEGEIKELIRREPALEFAKLVLITDSATPQHDEKNEFKLQRPITWDVLKKRLTHISMSSG
jgi:PleD family two-component response regulator